MIAFLKKEFLESLRTYKLLIMGAVFLLFGMMNPVIAKYTPELMESLAPEMGIQLPEPVMLDSWAQFFKNVGQLGLAALVIVFSGITAGELSRGTLITMLTKGLKRSSVILSKFTAAAVIWTLSYLMCFAVTYAYTAYFWSMDGMNNAFTAFFSMWLYGMLLINLVIIGGILFKSIYGSLLLTGCAVVVMALLNIIPGAQKYNPITLSSDNISLLAAQKGVQDFIPAIIICAVLCVLLLIASAAVFNKKNV